jgi:elongation factor Ts
MTEISAAMVKQLRDATSAGMMDCKRALVETGGDFDAAVKLLREKGMASAAKRADRETTEGLVLTHADDGYGTIVAVGCETEPVSKNEDFVAFAQDVLREVHDRGEEAVSVLEPQRVDLSAKLGENIRIVGARRIGMGSGEKLVAYVHPPAKKVGVIVDTRGGSPELPRELAMHIAFARPTYRTRDQVPAELVETEREILTNKYLENERDQIEANPGLAPKPDDVRSKIVDGMINKSLFGESVLEEQTWIHDTKLTVEKALQQGGLELIEYEWLSVG